MSTAGSPSGFFERLRLKCSRLQNGLVITVSTLTSANSPSISTSLIRHSGFLYSLPRRLRISKRAAKRREPTIYEYGLNGLVKASVTNDDAYVIGANIMRFISCKLYNIFIVSP